MLIPAVIILTLAHAAFTLVNIVGRPVALRL